ncbi:hypothetical protein Tco_0067665, partial [Tanacetum coccineum]
ASKRRNASKNKGKGTYSSSVVCGDSRDDGDSDALGNYVEKMDDVDGKGCDGMSVDVDSTDEGVKKDETEDVDVNEMEQGNVQDSSMDCTKGNDDGKEFSDGRKLFVEAIYENLIINDRKLECIPTELDENGVEVVVFDEVLVA